MLDRFVYGECIVDYNAGDHAARDTAYSLLYADRIGKIELTGEQRRLLKEIERSDVGSRAYTDAWLDLLCNHNRFRSCDDASTWVLFYEDCRVFLCRDGLPVIDESEVPSSANKVDDEDEIDDILADIGFPSSLEPPDVIYLHTDAIYIRFPLEDGFVHVLKPTA